MRRRDGNALYTVALVMQLVAVLAGIVGFFVCLGNDRVGLGFIVLTVCLGVIVGASMIRGRIRGEVQAQIQKHVTDDILGALTYADEGWWAAAVSVGDRKLGFKIGGDSRPDPGLVAHAREIVGSFVDFQARVSSFLAAESAQQQPDADEISALEIEDVCLFWPDRPDDGMIYFTGTNTNRVWRCDYVDRKPTSLGFDS